MLGLSLILFDFGVLNENTNDKSDLSLLPWLAIILPFLAMPVLFGSHAFDRFEKNKHLPFRERLSDAALEYINTSG